jgi:AcrR family transcriptional regulator
LNKAGGSRERSKVRQSRILEAALSVFSMRGYREASVDEIAVEAETSKGGVYFHFPGKQVLFRALLDLSAHRLRERVQDAIERESTPVARADAALLTVLRTFASHRSMARLFMVEVLAAGAEFQDRLMELHEEFIGLIRRHLDQAVEEGAVAPVDTALASRAWFGAVNEIILHWLITGEPRRLEDAYDALRPLLMRSVRVQETSNK